MVCPLCQSDQVFSLRTISSADIFRAYKNDVLYDPGSGVDVSDQFTNEFSDFKFQECNNCKLRFYDPMLLGDEKFYEKLQSYDWYYKEGGDDKSEFDYVAKKYLNKISSILEIGCGDGYFKNYIDTDYTGIDPYSQQDWVLKETIEEHSIKDIKYDAVCAFQTLEHTSNPRSFIENSIKCLKENGLLILSLPSEDGFLGQISDFSLNMPPHHVTQWTDKCLENIEKIFQIRLVEIMHEPITEFHKKILLENNYTFINRSINLDYGHTVIAVYQKSFMNSVAKVLNS